MKLYKIVFYFFLSSLIVLIATNPSLKQFKEYLPPEISIGYHRGYYKSLNRVDNSYRKRRNYLISSIFERTDYYYGREIGSKKYLGIFNNFVLIE